MYVNELCLQGIEYCFDGKFTFLIHIFLGKFSLYIIFPDDVIGKCISGDENDIHIARKYVQKMKQTHMFTFNKTKIDKFFFYREFLDPVAQSQFTGVFRDVHSIVNRHSIPWDHDYVQCRLQNSLFAIANKLPYSSAICWEKIPEGILDGDAFEAALQEAEQIVEKEKSDLDEDASIQYSPPSNNYADEVYYPPMKRRPNLM